MLNKIKSGTLMILSSVFILGNTSQFIQASDSESETLLQDSSSKKNENSNKRSAFSHNKPQSFYDMATSLPSKYWGSHEECSNHWVILLVCEIAAIAGFCLNYYLKDAFKLLKYSFKVGTQKNTLIYLSSRGVSLLLGFFVGWGVSVWSDTAWFGKVVGFIIAILLSYLIDKLASSRYKNYKYSAENLDRGIIFCIQVIGSLLIIFCMPTMLNELIKSEEKMNYIPKGICSMVGIAIVLIINYVSYWYQSKKLIKKNKFIKDNVLLDK